MVEKILGKRQAEDIYFSAFLSGLLAEKQASIISTEMKKKAAGDKFSWMKLLKGLGGAIGTAGGAAKEGVKAVGEIPKILGWTALLGGGTGALGAYAYDVLKNNVSREDDETKFNSELEAVYANKKKELESANWMRKVIAMRDDLRRSYKKIPTEEYKKKYDALVEALDERA